MYTDLRRPGDTFAVAGDGAIWLWSSNAKLLISSDI